MTEVTFVNAEVLRVAPDEVLIIKLPGDMAEDMDAVFSDLQEILKAVGLEKRSIIISGEFEMAVAKQDA